VHLRGISPHARDLAHLIAGGGPHDGPLDTMRRARAGLHAIARIERDAASLEEARDSLDAAYEYGLYLHRAHHMLRRRAA
jgi:hypothetical protein